MAKASLDPSYLTPTCDVDCKVDVTEVTANCTTTAILPPDNIVPPPNTGIKIPSVKDITTETIDGTGVFDIYMRAGMNQLNSQYEENRIKGAEFATAYIATMQLMMTEANKFVISLVQAEIAAKTFGQQYTGFAYDNAVKVSQAKKSKLEGDLICQQIAELKKNGASDRSLKAKQTQTQIKQAELYKRQVKGFDDKHRNDMFTQATNAWSVQAAQLLDADQAAIPELFGEPMGNLVKEALSLIVITKHKVHLLFPNLGNKEDMEILISANLCLEIQRQEIVLQIM